MILSDASLRAAIAAGHIAIEPFEDALIQPSSIDVRIDSMFRVFRNHTAGIIDVKADLTGLTELVEIPSDGVFMLHPGEFVLGSTIERLSVPDDLVARIEGKALSIGTPIPTPDGWTDLGDLRVGDFVFTVSGDPVRVKDATEVMLGRPCYEVLFSDGEVLIADESHEWITTPRGAARGLPRVMSTVAVRESLSGDSDAEHWVPLTAPVRCPEIGLPVDPYAAGRRLGDWWRRPVVYGADDVLVDESYDEQCWRPCSIPGVYLRASVGQREALFAGLIDSAGIGDEGGRCRFSALPESLALQIHELAAGLGFCPVLAKGPAPPDGIDDGPTYDVTFTLRRPVDGRSRQFALRAVDGADRHRSIVAVRPTPSVPVRCIEVDHPDGVYLAGRAFIPTHNSSLGRLGLLIHSTAGFIDSGFSGHITLELANVASLPITIYPGMKVGQVSFMQMTTPADVPYGRGELGSKYQGQRGPTPSRYFENFRDQP